MSALLTEEQMRQCLERIQSFARDNAMSVGQVLDSLEKFLEYRRKIRKAAVQ